MWGQHGARKETLSKNLNNSDIDEEGVTGVVNETGDDNYSSYAIDNEGVNFRVGTKVLGYFKSGKGAEKL